MVKKLVIFFLVLAVVGFYEAEVRKVSFESFFANVGEGVKDIFSRTPEVGIVELTGESVVEEGPAIVAPESPAESITAEAKNQLDDEFDRFSELDRQVEDEENGESTEEVAKTEEKSETPAPVQSQSPSASAKTCSFGDGTIGPIGPIIINEVAWMGTTASANDEWIELKNITTSDVVISGWQILDKAEQIKITFEDGEKIPPGRFYILERTDDTTVPNVQADKIYVGALSNADEGLRLYDPQCSLVDEILANPDWPAGSNSSKGTMERKSDLTWQSSAVFGGTPRGENSEPVPTAGGEGGSASEANQNETEASAADHVHISEIQVSGVDAGDEFVEFYNPTAGAVDMSGWSIQYVGGSAEVSTSTVSKKNFTSASTIAAKGFFLIARNTNASGTDGYVGLVSSDMGHRTFSLSGASAGAKVLLVSNQEAVQSASDPDIVDMLDYSFSVPAAGQSLERRALQDGVCVSAQGGGELLGNGCDTDADSDFEIRAVSGPQNSGSPPEP
ncbi:MAG: lamin tail domain-containing protein [Candidatus Brennerbacteria bacterium]|nr:lamin tail domain-containing protein [Candidatus Brennerbacteria bacterium]